MGTERGRISRDCTGLEEIGEGQWYGLGDVFGCLQGHAIPGSATVMCSGGSGLSMIPITIVATLGLWNV